MGTEVALEALRQALTLEKEGIRFYTEAAQKVSDSATQQTFLALLNDEKQHQSMILGQLRSLKANKGWKTYPAAVGARPLEGIGTLFPKGKPAIDKAVSQASTDVEALRFGLDIENRSFEFYFKAARDAETDEGRGMYSFLALVERGHFDTLMMRLEGLAGPLGWTY